MLLHYFYIDKIIRIKYLNIKNNNNFNKKNILYNCIILQ